VTKHGLTPLHAVALAMCTGFAAIAATAPVLQRAQGASDNDVALAGVCTSVGTVVGALWAGRRAANKRLLLGAVALLAAAAVALTVVEGIHPTWRLLDGVALGASLVACETLLLRSTTSTQRARTLALYTLATAGGWALGPLMSAALSSWRPAAGFAVAVVMAVLAMATATRFVPATIGNDDVDAALPVVESLSTLLRRNIAACATTLHFGAFQSAVLVVLPLHVLHQGNDGRVAMLAMAALAVGMLVFTLPNTSRGERHGPAVVMQAVCVVGGLAVIAAGLVPMNAVVAPALAFVMGGSLATLSPLSLLLLVRDNDAATLGTANALYNAHYAAGLALGPLVIVALIDVLSTGTLLVAMGAAWILHAAFIALTVPAAPTTVASAAVSTSGARS
jgi:MFS family permease